MNHAETETDAELLRRARAGVAPAFAVLVHRYAALLHAAASPEGGGAAHLDTVRRTFLRAMRRLDAADDTALGTWLLDLQGTPLSDDDADRAAPLATAELDQLWGELAPCWPRGRRPRRPPRWLGQVAIVLLLLALSVAVPYALLVTAADEEDDPPAPVDTPMPARARTRAVTAAARSARATGLGRLSARRTRAGTTSSRSRARGRENVTIGGPVRSAPG